MQYWETESLLREMHTYAYMTDTHLHVQTICVHRTHTKKHREYSEYTHINTEHICETHTNTKHTKHTCMEHTCKQKNIHIYRINTYN
jgi:hypothetical protein